MLVPMVAVARGGSGEGSTTPVEDPIIVTGEDEDSDRPDWAGPEGDHDLTPGRPNEDPGDLMGDLYGDLYVIVRDANGEPILYTWVWDGGVPAYPVVDPAGFPQPIAISDAEAELLGLDPLPDEFEGLVPLDVEGLVPEAYAEYTQEVDFGRLNLARAPTEFLDLAYEEAINAINNCDAIGLDPAGRLLLTVGEESKAIDAPRECLALYREIMRKGYLSGLTKDAMFMGGLDHLRQQGDGSVETTNGDLDTAACLFAGAADKGGFISVDKVVYTNSFLGINDLEAGTYFPFVTMGYTYKRSLAYGSVEAALLQGPVAGDYDVMFYLDEHVNIMNSVFGDVDAGPGTAGAAEFAHAADDALAVITYIHNWAVPEYDVEP